MPYLQTDTNVIFPTKTFENCTFCKSAPHTYKKVHFKILQNKFRSEKLQPNLLLESCSFQSLKVSSPEVLAMTLWSGDIAVCKTRNECPLKMKVLISLGYFQTIMSFSMNPCDEIIWLETLLQIMLQICEPVSTMSKQEFVLVDQIFILRSVLPPPVTKRVGSAGDQSIAFTAPLKSRMCQLGSFPLRISQMHTWLSSPPLTS